MPTAGASRDTIQLLMWIFGEMVTILRASPDTLDRRLELAYMLSFGSHRTRVVLQLNANLLPRARDLLVGTCEDF